MIIRRYLAGQLMVSALAVTALLTFILMGGRVIKYFGMAAQGRLDVELLSAVLLYRLPGFLEMILPLGLFIAVLLVFGRLYVDNEMAVLAASGVSRWQLAGMALPTVILTMAVIAVFSLYVTPAGNYKSEALFAAQAKRNTFDMIRPGEFQQVNGRMLYARAMTPDQTRLLDVMMYEERRGDGQPALVMADSARRYTDPASGVAYIELLRGERYEVQPGSPAHSRLHFETYRMRVRDAASVGEITRARTLTTPVLYRKQQAGDRLAQGEWLWRLSMPLLAPIAALLALPLARVNPRQGRFLKLFPAILLYISLVVLIASVRNGVEKGKLDAGAVWAVHAGYGLLGLLLLGWEDVRLAMRRRLSGGKAL